MISVRCATGDSITEILVWSLSSSKAIDVLISSCYSIVLLKLDTISGVAQPLARYAMTVSAMHTNPTEHAPCHVVG